MSNYNKNYFEEGIFDTDYAKIAEIICDTFSPKTIAELGCGNGYLTRELAYRGVAVDAIDAYSHPTFTSERINFQRFDLNDLDNEIPLLKIKNMIWLSAWK